MDPVFTVDFDQGMRTHGGKLMLTQRKQEAPHGSLWFRTLVPRVRLHFLGPRLLSACGHHVHHPAALKRSNPPSDDALLPK